MWVRIESATRVVNHYFRSRFNGLSNTPAPVMIAVARGQVKQLTVLIAVAFLSFHFHSVRQTPAHASGQHRKDRSARSDGRSKDFLALIKDLRAGGSTVKTSGERISQPFFSARGQLIYLNDESVWVFPYASTAAADKDASKVSSDGMTIGKSKPSWLGTPHFYRRDRIIVLYLGDKPGVLDVLTHTFGRQFAGG